MRRKKRSPDLFPPLDHCVKNVFPFPIGCPSFIYRAGYVDNVTYLAPFVDEIQLLFFESRHAQSLPTPSLVRDLAALSDNHGITFNVHLPSDLFFGHPDPSERRHAVDTIEQIINCCGPLDPTTFTLHLNRNPHDSPKLSLPQWQNMLIENLASVLDSVVSGRKISVENIDDSLEQAASVIHTLDLSVCMDLGHLMAHDIDIASFYRQWNERISIFHLHGVKNKQDHLPLDKLCREKMDQVMDILSQFTGPVILEVYSLNALNASMKCLKEKWCIAHSTKSE